MIESDMAQVPVTSVSLIRALADDPQSTRWNELYERYLPAMSGFLQAKFPSLEPEDVIQETLVALFRKLPDYRYTPDEKGHFRNYLMGILKHKAMDALERRRREAEKKDDYARSPRTSDGSHDNSWRDAALEVAIQQLMSDASVNARHREVFRAVALEHRKPEAVAERFGISRGNVDQIKRRLIERLSEIVSQLITDKD